MPIRGDTFQYRVNASNQMICGNNLIKAELVEKLFLAA
jgi:hypothetical protein